MGFLQIRGCLYRGNRRLRVRGSFEDAALLVLKWEEEAEGQETQAASRAGKGKETHFLLELPEGAQLSGYFNFSPVRSILDL